MSRSGLTVGSLRGVALGSASRSSSAAASEGSSRLATESRTRGKLALALAPQRRRGCCGTGCVGCPYGDWLRRARALGAP